MCVLLLELKISHGYGIKGVGNYIPQVWIFKVENDGTWATKLLCPHNMRQNFKILKDPIFGRGNEGYCLKRNELDMLTV